MMKKTFLLSTIILFSTLSHASCKNNNTSENVATKYTITFNLNGGTMPSYQSSMTKEVEANQAVGDLPIPTKENSIFIGWYLGNSVNDGQLTSITMINKDVDVYARYKEDDESIIVDYDDKVELDAINVIEVSLSNQLQDQGFTYSIDKKENIVIVSKTENKLIYKAIKSGDVNFKISSVSNPSKYINLKITIAESVSLLKAIDNLTKLNSYTYTGFTIENGNEKVESIIRATDKILTQLDSNNKACYTSNSIPRYGVAINNYKEAYYIDSSSESDNNSFKTSPSLIITDSGFLNETNFQGNPISTLNDSSEIFGFKALSTSWFSTLNSYNSTYEIEGDSSHPELSMIEAALVKMTSPSLYKETSSYSSSTTDFPYIEIASRVNTKIHLLSNEYIFVEINYNDKTYYGRVSDINKTSQAYVISNYVSSRASTSIGKSDYSDKKGLKDLNSVSGAGQDYGGVRSETVTLTLDDHSSSPETTTFPLYTFFNSKYVFRYFSPEFIKFEKRGVIKNYYFTDKDNPTKEPNIGYVKKTSSNSIYPFTFNLYDNEGAIKSSRTASDIVISSQSSSSQSIADNFPITSTKAFYKTDLIYTFKETKDIDKETYYISYSDDVYNQNALFEAKNTTSLRKITALKAIYDETGSNLQGYKVKIGHLDNGRDITWDNDYTFKDIGKGSLSYTSTVAVEDGGNIDKNLRNKF